MLAPEIDALFQGVLQDSLFKRAGEVGDELEYPVYLIGGFVRDVILQRPCKDIDIVVVGNGITYAEALAQRLGIHNGIHLFKNFGTAQFTHQGYQVEIVGARKESYRHDSRKPTVDTGSLEDDQNRRDFTMNTLAIQLNISSFGKWIDSFGGLKDLADGVIRTPLDPDITYADDPLRIMRAIRFSSQLHFTIEQDSWEALARNAHRISIVSMERVVDELNKIILSDIPSEGMRLLDKSGILDIIFPEFVALKGAEYIEGKGHKDNFHHTLEVLDNLSQHTRDLWLRWAALLHDIAKPQTRRFDKETGWTFHNHEFKGAKMVPQLFKRLKLPLHEKMKYVQKLVLLHLRPIVLADEVVTDSAVRRLLFDAGDDIDDLMMLCEADITSKNPEKVRRYLANFNHVREKLREIEEKDRIRNWQPPISGERIMEVFGIKPSREVGIIKTAIREAILDGVIPNDEDQAFDLMLAEGKKLGLKKVT